MAKGQYKRGIQKKIVTAIFIVGVLPLIMGISLTYLNGRKNLKTSIGTKFQEIAKQTANKVDMFIEQEILEAQGIALSPVIRKVVKNTNKSYKDGKDAEIRLLNNEAANYLKSYQELRKEEYIAILLTNEKGNMVAATKDIEDHYQGGDAWWQIAFNQGKGGTFVTNFYFDQMEKEYLMDMAVPIMDESGKNAIGAIKFVIKNFKIFEMIKDIQIDETGHAMLITSDKVILICPIFPPESHRIIDPVIRKIAMDQPGWTIVEDNAHGGKNAISGFAPVQSTYRLGAENFNGKRWYIFISQNPEETYAPIYSLLWRVSIYGLLLIGIISIMGYFAAYRIVTPIQTLQKGAALIGQGNLNHRLDIHTNDEIEQLANEFNNMAIELKGFYSALEQKVEERTMELKEAQSKLIQSERLLSMGQVAAGIGHELRNPLGVIRNSVYYLKGKISYQDPKIIKHFNIVEKEIANSNKILSDLLNFSRPMKLTLRLMDINKVIEEAAAYNNIPERVNVLKELDTNISPFQLDRDLILQVFNNIILNSIDAMQDGGTLAIRTAIRPHTIDLQSDSVKQERGIGSKAYSLKSNFIEVSFSDTGKGIAEENQSKLFNPFFTTKAKGIGLGLAVSKRVIEEHKGSIEIMSKVDKGTTVTIRLPVDDGSGVQQV